MLTIIDTLELQFRMGGTIAPGFAKGFVEK